MNNYLEPRLSVSERTIFAKRLSFLIKAGMPLLESMHILQKQTKSDSKKKIFNQIIEDIANGKPLATSLQRFPKMFGQFAINLIKVGETSGILDQNLQYLAKELQKQHALRRKVIGALIYPIFITIATLAVTGLLTVYIFPKLMPIFTSLHVHLPVTTRILIFTSTYLQQWGVLTVLGLLGIGILFVVARAKVASFALLVDTWVLKIPLFGTMLKSYHLATITRTSGLLLQSGIKVVESLTITAETTGNRAYKQSLHSIAEKTLRGEQISKSLECYQEIFPDLVSHMVAIGETTGNLPETFLYLSEMYEAEMEDTTKNLSSSIEPLLMVFMGVLVGFVAVSVITPIYDVTQHLKR